MKITKHDLVIADMEMVIADMKSGRVRAMREILHAKAKIAELEANVSKTDELIAEKEAELEQVRAARDEETKK